MKVRIKFKKNGVMKFVGHLDLMRFFQKLLRRAHIPVALTKGFSPHMIMSFASPLGIGQESDGEYVDLELTAPVSTDDALSRLNAHSVPGIVITDFRRISDDKKMTAMTILEAASYTFFIKNGDKTMTREDLIPLVETFNHAETLLIEKKTKRSLAVKDIRPLVYEMSVNDDGSLYVMCAAGSRENIKPELIAKALEILPYGSTSDAAFADLFQPSGIKRMEMYAMDHNSFVPLSEMGERIQ